MGWCDALLKNGMVDLALFFIGVLVGCWLKRNDREKGEAAGRMHARKLIEKMDALKNGDRR
jgi:hypothetical protein